jgi:hypothetical protein
MSLGDRQLSAQFLAEGGNLRCDVRLSIDALRNSSYAGNSASCTLASSNAMCAMRLRVFRLPLHLAIPGDAKSHITNGEASIAAAIRALAVFMNVTNYEPT